MHQTGTTVPRRLEARRAAAMIANPQVAAVLIGVA
jgi:hypothetical protein